LSQLLETLELNNANAIETSYLDQPSLEWMIAHSFYQVTQGADGLLITFDQDAPYEGINFHWFKARFDRFIYVDRIVISAHARCHGLAKKYYTQLFDRAINAGHTRITCEINLDPPNEASMCFHAQMGFTQIGQAILENGKTVSYQEKLL
jgi:uncharacterized protein